MRALSRGAAAACVLCYQAAVHHPLWSQGRRCYNRFFGWAAGDGALIAMYPQLCYYSFPCGAEACATLLLLAAASAGIACMLFSICQFLQLVMWPGQLHALGWPPPYSADTRAARGVILPGCLSLLQYSLALVSAAVGFKAVDLLLDLLRAFHPVRNPAGSQCCCCCL